MAKISKKQAHQLSGILLTAQEQAGLSAEDLRREAERWLFDRGIEVDLDPRTLSGFMSSPSNPFHNRKRANQLSAVVAVLGVDRDKVNRLCGGVWG